MFPNPLCSARPPGTTPTRLALKYLRTCSALPDPPGNNPALLAPQNTPFHSSPPRTRPSTPRPPEHALPLLVTQNMSFHSHLASSPA
eukprot:364542-Chlamydomonas_euryale.AAC.14